MGDKSKRRLCRNCVRPGENRRRISPLSVSHQGVGCGGKSSIGLRVDVIRYRSLRFARIAFQACSFNQQLAVTLQGAITAIVISPQKVTRSRSTSSIPVIKAVPIDQSRASEAHQSSVGESSRVIRCWTPIRRPVHRPWPPDAGAGRLTARSSASAPRGSRALQNLPGRQVPNNAPILRSLIVRGRIPAMSAPRPVMTR